ncbi:MAG: response regulator transcription factor [Thermoanaerobaculia bacterium]
MASHEILLIEDEPGLLMSLTDRLESEGYGVETAADGDSGLARGLEGRFDLILLDVMLPKKNGFDVCRDLRREGVETPVLMLTARGQVVDKVVGLKLGADDYLTKPFDMMELLARVEVLLRRSRSTATAAGGRYAFGDVTVDFRRARITRGGEPVDLSALEYKLLRYFIEQRDELLSRDHLLDKVWGYDAEVYSRTVDQHVAALRRKLEPTPSHPQFILTVHGLGYRFAG